MNLLVAVHLGTKKQMILVVNMKNLVLIFCCTISLCVAAQNNNNISLLDTTFSMNEEYSITDTVEEVSLIVYDMPNAIVHQDSALMRLMFDKRVGRVRGEQLIDGFRVQIYASNAQQVAKNEALILQQQVESQLEVPVYTQSEPPFWKVRVGNFKTREEANQYKIIFLNLFPEMAGSTYVVPDKVVIMQ